MPLEKEVQSVLRKKLKGSLGIAAFFHKYDTDILSTLSRMVGDDKMITAYERPPTEEERARFEQLSKVDNIHMIDDIPRPKDNSGLYGLVVVKGFDWMFKRQFYSASARRFGGPGPNAALMEQVQSVVIPEYYYLNIIEKGTSEKQVHKIINLLAHAMPLLHLIEDKEETHLLYQRLYEKEKQSLL